MIYPTDFESKLGFDQVRQSLSDYCIGMPGRNEVDRIQFYTDFSSIRIRLQQGWEFKSLKERGMPFPLSQYCDPTTLYPVIAIEGSFIEGEFLHEIALSLRVITDCINFLTKSKEEFPNLFLLTTPVNIPNHLADAINKKVDDKGLLKDNASVDLQKIRKKLRDEVGRARRLIDQLFKDAVSSGIVPEGSSPVIREGRVVIPVLSEYKRKVRGVIMDESATGQTVFMEPTEVIEANNEIRNLELEERRESIKLLKELTGLLRNHLDELKTGFNFLAQLDCIQAKTKYAISIDARIPKLTDEPSLNWIGARHPLLFLSHKGKGVVPLTISLNSEDRFLLVSGPNAGGKSVCLKTIGLVQYMAQCGLLVPMDEESTVGIFNKIYLDIGDQQSIENDLSTYSSHLRNMRYFTEKAGDDALVLMDELGAGTDPNFGGGIAEAILKTLVQKRVWGVATTHYYNLKLFADNCDGIRNAAMQFDSKKLEPLFVLDIGKPGSSFALEIARKTGLSAKIISEAEEIIGKDLTGLESLIKKVNDERQSLSKQSIEVRNKEIKYRELLNKYNQLTEELESKKNAIVNKAKEEAALLLKQTNKEIEKTIRHIKENRAEKKETQRVRKNLEGLGKVVRPGLADKTLTNEKLEVGDYVRIKGQEVSGKMVSITGSNAVVQFGDMRSTIKLDRLTKSTARESQSPVRTPRASGVDLFSKQANFNASLDVRGKRVDEIIPLIDQFLDDAVLLGHGTLRILHGKGEGVLRKVIRERLTENKNVASFNNEHIDRGGDGITLVVLK